MPHPRIEHELEQLVDATTIYDVVETLRSICYEKADHLRSNWQDGDTARAWDRAAKALDTASERIFKLDL